MFDQPRGHEQKRSLTQPLRLPQFGITTSTGILGLREDIISGLLESLRSYGGAQGVAPPEVLLRQGTRSGWALERNEWEIPCTTVLEGTVGGRSQLLVLMPFQFPS